MAEQAARCSACEQVVIGDHKLTHLGVDGVCGWCMEARQKQDRISEERGVKAMASWKAGTCSECGEEGQVQGPYTDGRSLCDPCRAAEAQAELDSKTAEKERAMAENTDAGVKTPKAPKVPKAPKAGGHIRPVGTYSLQVVDSAGKVVKTATFTSYTTKKGKAGLRAELPAGSPPPKGLHCWGSVYAREVVA